MSAGAVKSQGSGAPALLGGPSLAAKLAAAAVLVALGALAYYAMFSGPTTVSVKVPASAPSHAAKQAPQGEPGEGGERGD